MMYAVVRFRIVRWNSSHCSKAMQLHYISISYNFVGDVITPKIVKKQIQSYNEDEVKKLFELVDKDASSNVKLLIYLAITTGMRRSEINALTFDDVDLKEKTINVNNARVYQHRGKCVLKEPKTASSVRVIPITDFTDKEGTYPRASKEID